MQTACPVTISSVRRTDDAITRFVEAVVISRTQVTPEAFDMAVTFVAELVSHRWELSKEGARQAVEPIMRRLTPPVCPKTTVVVRRPVTKEA